MLQLDKVCILVLTERHVTIHFEYTHFHLSAVIVEATLHLLKLIYKANKRGIINHSKNTVSREVDLCC